MKSKFLDTPNSELILDSIADAVVVIDLNKKIHYVNKASEELVGYTSDEMLGKTCKEVFQCEDCSIGCLLDRTLETNKPVTNYERNIRHRMGRRVTVSSSTAVIKDPNGEIIAAAEVIRDLSKIRELTEQLQEKYSFDSIVGKNAKIQEIFQLLPAIAHSKSSVLIQGESGTGKELIAEAIHHNSPRRNGPFIKVNCAALAEGILESELFGHVKGAFTGAMVNKLGRFELADKGSIFLDEIADLKQSTQVKLLRVLQEEEFERVGGIAKIKIDVRVIAATNKDLHKLVDEGAFREDLYYRLRVIPINLPPLRDRREDIPILIKHFMHKFNKEMGKQITNIVPEVMEFLMEYEYPGNIRELENIMEHAFVLSQSNTIHTEHLPKDLFSTDKRLVGQASEKDNPLKSLERELIQRILGQTQWKYNDAAKRLNLSRTTLWRKMRELGIKKAMFLK